MTKKKTHPDTLGYSPYDLAKAMFLFNTGKTYEQVGITKEGARD